MAKKNDGTAVEERVKLYAVNKKYKEKPFLVTAVTDTVNRVFVTGQEHLSADELKSSELVINASDNHMIRNNDELVLLRFPNGSYKLNRDYAIYCLLQVVPEVAKSKDDVISGFHLFYMQNFEQEAEKKISISKVRAKAYAKVVDLATLKDMMDILFYFGENAANATQKTAEAKIYGIVETRPEEIVTYFENIELSNKLVFVKKLIHYALIKKQTNGYLVYGDVVLGANEKEATVFLYDDKNNKVYVPLKDQLDKLSGIK
jgi:hypothetical protein